MKLFHCTGLGLPALAVLAMLSQSADGATVAAYYTFDNQNAMDLSSNANHGNAGASVAFSTDTPGAVGGGFAAQFNGTSGPAGLISVPNSPSLEALDDSMSVAFWIKMDHTVNPNWVRVTRKGTEANGSDGWMVTRNNNTSDLLMRTDTTGVGGSFNQNRSQGVGVGMLDGTWHHYIHVRDNGNWSEYVDGLLTGSGTYPHGDGFGNTQPLLIGGRGDPSITGLIDEYSIWNGALSAGEIARLSSGGPAIIPEPATTSLALVGLAGLIMRRRRMA